MVPAEVAEKGFPSFETPVKKIHDVSDVTFFLTSFAYRELMTFILRLNSSLVPRKTNQVAKIEVRTWPLGSEDVAFSDKVTSLISLLKKLEDLLAEAPPDTGPRRFGNVSFRTWHKLVEQRVPSLLKDHIPGLEPGFDELGAYLLGSFGSPQRLDYGTGHELSFVAFLGGLWKLGHFAATSDGSEERSIVLGIFEPYLNLVRSLIKTYTLEPAGSHGVWGLDDNSFLPYMFGSAQLSPAITSDEETPIQGSLPDAPSPGSIAKANIVEREKAKNMYFSAIAFIFDVKKGPFWEHSPMLYDISGIKDGWGKINKGMIKMYNAEVLSKFPVVQHFPFGSLYRWEKDPEARPPLASTHTSSQPLRNPNYTHAPSAARPGPTTAAISGTAAPWASRPAAPPAGFVNGVTQAPWASTARAPPPRVGLQGQMRRPPPPIIKRPKAGDQKTEP